MPEVKSADDATNIALDFARKHRALGGRALSAQRENGNWVVEVDLGLFEIIKGRVTIDAQTGAILTYHFPR